MIIVEGTRVLIRPDKKEEKTEGGLFVPQQTQDQLARAMTQGTFVASGPNADLNFGKAELCAGDRVAFVRYAGEDLEDTDGTVYWIMQDMDLLALLVNDK